MNNTTTTFDTTEIESKVSDLRTQMDRVQEQINEMNNAINGAPLESNNISSLLQGMAKTLTTAHQKLEALFQECQLDIMEASGQLDLKTRMMEQKLSQRS